METTILQAKKDESQEKIDEKETLGEERNEEEVGFYELSFLLADDLSDSLIAETISNLKDSINSAGGIVIEDSWPKKIKLAYPIKKNNFAYFGYLLFDYPRKEIEKFSQEVKKNSNILRYLLISRNKKYWQRDKESKENWLKRRGKKEAAEINEEELEKKLEEVLK